MIPKIVVSDVNTEILRHLYGIDDQEFGWILNIAEGMEYKEIADKMGGTWTEDRIKQQIRKVKNRINKYRGNSFLKIESPIQLLNALEMILF